MKRARVVATGAYLPSRILTNHDLERMVETRHEWIVERTGIGQRHIAAKNEMTSDLAIHAGKMALQRAGMDADAIDMLILATTTPDLTFPATATRVQHLLGMTRGAAFDVSAACSGFVYGLSLARALIASSQARRVMVIGAETFSRLLDWTDRTTSILFGDGAGAMILEAAASGEGEEDRGILSCNIHSDGRYAELLHTSGGVSTTGNSGHIVMQGKEVFRHAVTKMIESTQEALAEAHLPLSAVDWFVPHQANARILQAMAEKMELDAAKIVSAVGSHANTSAASIPLALHAAVEDGRIKPGHVLALPALGAGLTWGCCIIKW